MEWLALIAQLILLGVFLLWEGYFKEKGKNLATKEDIKDITDKVESVKDSYNKALEAHKIELQKEFELHKYRIKLCNSIDEQLIELVSNALKIYHEEGVSYPESDDLKLISAAHRISIFFSSYFSRYSHIKQFEELRDISDNIKIEAELGAPIISVQDKKDFIYKLSSAIALFLPRL